MSCGKEIYKTQSQYKKHKNHYCSNKCQSNLRHKQTYEDRPCDTCGKLMHISKKSMQKFCSYECQHIWQRTRIGKLNPRYQGISVNCTYCGREFDTSPHKTKNGQANLCSRKCYRRWYAEIWSQSEEWKNKSRIRAANILESNRGLKISKPQRIINEFLNDMKIKYINEKNYKYYTVDNYLVESNLIIEVMGDYWHTNPTKYNAISPKIQLNRIIKDKTKHSYIKKYYNIEILYLWESDIIKNIEVCRNLIEEYIIKKGILENYHSFNYHINDGKLLLNKHIIIPYQSLSNLKYKIKAIAELTP